MSDRRSAMWLICARATSGCVDSRPRKRTTRRTLWPSSRKRRAARARTCRSCSSVRGRRRSSFSSEVCSLFLLFLVLELAVVQDLAHWRLSVWGDFDEIELLPPGHLERLGDRQDADLLAVFVDHPYFRNAYLLVDAWSRWHGRALWNASRCRYELGTSRALCPPECKASSAPCPL